MNINHNRIWVTILMTLSCFAFSFAQYRVKESEGNKSVIVESTVAETTTVVVELAPYKPYKNPCSEKTFPVRGFTNIRVAYVEDESNHIMVMCKEPSEEAFQPSD